MPGRRLARGARLRPRPPMQARAPGILQARLRIISIMMTMTKDMALPPVDAAPVAVHCAAIPMLLRVLLGTLLVRTWRQVFDGAPHPLTHSRMLLPIRPMLELLPRLLQCPRQLRLHSHGRSRCYLRSSPSADSPSGLSCSRSRTLSRTPLVQCYRLACWPPFPLLLSALQRISRLLIDPSGLLSAQAVVLDLPALGCSSTTTMGVATAMAPKDSTTMTSSIPAGHSPMMTRRTSSSCTSRRSSSTMRSCSRLQRPWRDDELRR